MASDLPSLRTIDVTVDPDKFDGKTVRVEGWLIKCRPTACSLSQNRDEDGAALALGDSASFDKAVRNLIGRRIVVEGEVDTMGFEHWRTGDDGDMILTWPKAKPGHRIGQLLHPRLVSVFSRQ